MLENKLGVSLIELMLALLISSLLLSFLVGMYVSIHHAHQFIVALDTIQENEILASSIFNAAVSKAGYIGCAKLTSEFPLVNHTTILFNANNKLSYTERGDVHGFTARYMDQNNSFLVKDMRGYSTLYVSKKIDIFPADILIISNCKSAEIFQVKDVVKQVDSLKITTQTPLANRYEKDALVGGYKEESYFVDTNVLWMKDAIKKNEILTGVESMQVTFAIADNGRMKMVSSDSLPNEKRGIGVKLQFFSPDGIELHQSWYGFIGLP